MMKGSWKKKRKTNEAAREEEIKAGARAHLVSGSGITCQNNRTEDEFTSTYSKCLHLHKYCLYVYYKCVDYQPGKVGPRPL